MFGKWRSIYVRCDLLIMDCVRSVSVLMLLIGNHTEWNWCWRSWQQRWFMSFSQLPSPMSFFYLSSATCHVVGKWCGCRSSVYPTELRYLTHFRWRRQRVDPLLFVSWVVCQSSLIWMKKVHDSACWHLNVRDLGHLMPISFHLKNKSVQIYNLSFIFSSFVLCGLN